MLTPSCEVSAPSMTAQPEHTTTQVRRQYQRAYYLANRERLKAQRKAYRDAHRDEIARQGKAYREANSAALKAKRDACREDTSAKNRKYYAANKEAIRARTKRWLANNAERVSAVAAEYRRKHPQKARAYYLANKRERHKWFSKWQTAKRQSDPSFAVQCKVLSWTCRAMRRHLSGLPVSKSTRIVQLLGCDWLEFIAHIEAKFDQGMSWSNHGRSGWHFDHILPLSSFDLTDEAELSRACHYTNVQPLWAADNVRKGATIA